MPPQYAEPLARLIEEFKKMPGIGPKSAQRLSFYILGSSDAQVDSLAQALQKAKKSITYCSKCFNITVDDPCIICNGNGREPSTICVVAEPKDLLAMERAGKFKGLYHVLGGVISPLDGFGPENLRIKELLKRIDSNIKEIVLAINPTTEGEATILYLTKLLKPLGVKLTKIAYGLPMGSDMDYADEITLVKALEGRREVD